MAFLNLGEPRLQPGPHRLGELPEHGVSYIQPMLGGLVRGLRIPGHEILQVDLPQRIGPAQLPQRAEGHGGEPFLVDEAGDLKGRQGDFEAAKPLMSTSTPLSSSAQPSVRS
jgi:hypothetical protein